MAQLFARPPKLPIFFGVLVGGALCFGFYKVTGLRLTLLSAAPWERQAADVVCYMAFAVFGVFVVKLLFGIKRSDL